MTTIPNHPLPQQSIALDVIVWGEVQHYNAYEPHRHEYHELLIFEKGQAWHEVDFREYEVTAPAIHLVRAGQVHMVRRKPGNRGFSLLFDGGAIEETPLLAQSPMLALSPEEWATLQPVCEGLLRETGSGNKNMLLHWFRLCMAYAASFAGQAMASESAPTHRLVASFRQLLAIHYTEHLRPGAYADKLCVSAAHLNRVCRRETGKSASELIQAFLIEEVKRQLIYTQLPIKEIAYSLNFEDPAYFHRFFKQHTGMTPAAFREKLA